MQRKVCPFIFVPQLSITCKRKKNFNILRQKYETGDFAPKISIRSRRIKFLHIAMYMTSKLRTFLWCFSFFSKLLVDTMSIRMNDPSDFKNSVPDDLVRKWVGFQPLRSLADGCFDDGEYVKESEMSSSR